MRRRVKSGASPTFRKDMANNTQGFSSTFGAIMAAAGSAIGLGNIWRFPYICGKYGGGAALVLYLLFVFVIGMTLLLSELVIGRRSGHAAVMAYATLKPKRPQWRYIGLFGVVTCFLILAIYYVISGWTLNYFWESVNGTLSHITSGSFDAHFSSFASSAAMPLVCLLVFAAINLIIILCGVQNGIEKVSARFGCFTVCSFAYLARRFARFVLSIPSGFFVAHCRRCVGYIRSGSFLIVCGHGCDGCLW